MSIQKCLFSNQSLTKGVQWNRTRRAIAAQEGVSIAKGGQESNSAYNFSIYLPALERRVFDQRVSLIIVRIFLRLGLI